MKQAEKIFQLPIDEILVAAANELIYHRVNPLDPATRELAQSIGEHGILTPLILTRDHVIVSGHRRYAAARIAGLDKVPCRILPIQSSVLSHRCAGERPRRLVNEPNRR